MCFVNLESKWLEDFSALASTRSFSQAAERRFVTQPAFSRRIRSLEAALGLQLVNRSRTPIELTEAGQLFLVTARTVVDQLSEILRHLHHLEGGQGEVVQVAAAHSLASGFFPRWVAQLRNDGLNIATRLVATNVGDAVHALREGGCDLMLAFYDPDAALQMDAEIFPSLHMGNTEMLPVCAVDAEGKPLFDLEGEGSVPLLAYTAGAFLGRSVNLLLRQRNLRYTTVYETAMADSLKSMALEAWVLPGYRACRCVASWNGASWPSAAAASGTCHWKFACTAAPWCARPTSGCCGASSRVRRRLTQKSAKAPKIRPDSWSPGCLKRTTLRYTARPFDRMRPVQISKQATPVVPRGLLFFDAPAGAQAKRLDDECTGWRDHGLQVRLVHP